MIRVAELLQRGHRVDAVPHGLGAFDTQKGQLSEENRRIGVGLAPVEQTLFDRFVPFLPVGQGP